MKTLIFKSISFSGINLPIDLPAKSDFFCLSRSFLLEIEQIHNNEYSWFKNQREGGFHQYNRFLADLTLIMQS